MKKIKITAILSAMLLCMSLYGCSGGAVSNTATTGQESASTGSGGVSSGSASDQSTTGVDSGASGSNNGQTATVTPVKTAETIDWQSENYTTIDLNSGSAEISKSGVYLLTGSLTDGTVTVNSADEGTVYLVLQNAQIESKSGTPLHILAAKEVVILLEEGSDNTITQGIIENTDENTPTAAIFSKADTTITGSGSLIVNTTHQDGITSKDDLIITGGNIQVNAASDGIVGKDLLQISSATITVTAGKDGLRATNATDEGKGNLLIESGDITITAACDGIQAERTLEILDGTISVTSGGGYGGAIKTDSMGGGGRPGMNTQSTTTVITDEESRKAIKAGTALTVQGGNLTLSSYEDALHTNGDLRIEGGNIGIEAGDDGVHADLSVTISGGEIAVNNSYEGIEGSGVTIHEGIISVISTDDGINVSASGGVMSISGGTLSVKAGGDGIDSNGNIQVSGGTVTIDTGTIGPGNSAIDSDSGCTITGGSIVDQNGTAIDPNTQGMGGGRGGMKPGRMADQ